MDRTDSVALLQSGNSLQTTHADFMMVFCHFLDKGGLSAIQQPQTL
jgi:hypothetical protein